MALHVRPPSLWLFIAALLSAAAPSRAQPVPAMFRGDPSPAGEVETIGVDRLGGIAWRFDVGSAVRSSPIVADGVVYVGSSAGDVVALGAESGTLLWRVSLGSAVGGAPLVTDDHVVVIDRANRIHGIDRESGDRTWTVQGGPDVPLDWGLEGWDYVLASPALADSVVVAGTGDGIVYGVHLDHGEVLWRFDTGGRIRSSAFVGGGVAYVGSGSGILHGISVSDGSEVWRFETAGASWSSADWGFDRRQIYSSPTVVDGVLYVGSRDASLYAIDLERRDTMWTFVDGTAWVISSPAVADGHVFSARSGSRKVRSVDARSGNESWSVLTGGYVFSSPRIVGSIVYIGSEDGNLYSLDADTGEVRWSYRTGGGVYSTPAIWDGRLYVGSDDGFLYAFEATDGPQPQLAVFWDDELMDASVWGGQEEHRKVADYFAGLGYEVLNATALDSFLVARLEDVVPSVLVAAMDGLPESVFSLPGDDGLFRRYLNDGGKVVWMGLPPLVLERNEDGQVTGVNRDKPGSLLGVSHAAWNADEYPTVATSEGHRWGLKSGRVAMGGIAPAESITVLAMDEIGRAAMWVREYGGPTGTGFVSVRMGTEGAYLDELRDVVEYGILRRP